MKKIGVVAVPYILYDYHFIFMVQTVLSLLQAKQEGLSLELIAVVNGFRGSDDDYAWVKDSFDIVEINDRNNLARAWNKGIRKALEQGADYVLVINLDLVFHSEFLQKIVAFAAEHSDALIWSGRPWINQESLETVPLEEGWNNEADMSCFMIDKRLFEKIGEFDEQYEPAYHEDKDMLYRIKVAGGVVKECFSARYFHIDRTTLKGAMVNNDVALLETTRMQMDLSMERYAKKWGGLPGDEKFIVPYGGKPPGS